MLRGVRGSRAADVVHSLLEARDARELGRLHRRLHHIELLVLDALGFVPFDRTGGELLFICSQSVTSDRQVVVKTRTATDRFRRALRSISQWCKANRHEPLERQQRVLNQKLWWHYGYYGRKGNRARCANLRYWFVLEWWRGYAAARSAASPGAQ